MALVAASVGCRAEMNLCPNPGFEQAAEDGTGPLGWENENGGGRWASDEVHSGERSVKLQAPQTDTILWTSDVIPVDPKKQLILSVWAKLEGVEGSRGAAIVLYHIDDEGERIGQSATLFLGGSGANPGTKPWRQHFAASELTPEVAGVRVNLRIYRASGTAWFDDVTLQEAQWMPIEEPIALRRGLDLVAPEGLAIVTAEGANSEAERIRDGLRARGVRVEIVPDDTDLQAESRDLIVLGNLATSRASEFLYRRYYTFEDLCFPGPAGWVLRPVVNPLGNGVNLLVVGASDAAGLKPATDRLLEQLPDSGEPMNVDLQVQTGEGYLGNEYFPWPASTPWREIKYAADYHKSGDLEHARTYRQYVLDNWFEENHRDWRHLFYITKTLSWELMHTAPVFTDEERLRITNELLKHLRGDQGYGYAGLREERMIRENHATRAARAFYFGWRHFARYYPEHMPAELALWRRKLESFWTLCLSSFRSREDSLSQHALGGSLDNTLDIALMEPEWSGDFWASDLPRLMGERCIAISNNMGQTVMLGDTTATDYATSVFSKLAYALEDGRYQFMIDKRGRMVTGTDEPMRGFVTGVEPAVPEDHVGLAVVPADELYFETELDYTMGVGLDEAFDKLTFRSGFTADDEYLMLDGVSGGTHSYDDVNTVGEFSDNERRWLVEMDRLKGPSMAFHNGVTVARDGLGAKKHGQAARLTDTAEGDGWAWTATTVPRDNGVDWNRHIVWLSGRLAFVLDEMTANDPGDYSFVLGWRSIGEPSLSPGLFEARQDAVSRPGVSLDGSALAEAASISADVPFYHTASWDGLFARTTEVGQRVEIVVDTPEAGAYELHLTTVDVASRGILQVSVDGEDVGEPVDMYAEDLTFTEHEVGTVELEAGEHTVCFEVVGSHEASGGYMIGLQGLLLATREQLAAGGEVRPNRFWLQFPRGQTATLKRDYELLGPDLPYNPWAEQVLNILEQPMSTILEAGDSACLMNIFHARRNREGPQFGLRRLNSHCALIRSEAGVALIGASVVRAGATVGPLAASGRLFYIGPDRVILHGAEASVGGAALRHGEPAPEAALRALAEAWPSTGGQPADDRGPWRDTPQLVELWRADLPARPRSAIVRTAGNGALVDLGLEDGTVVQFGPSGEVRGDFATGGPVHALEAADLTGDGGQELLAGSDAETLHALDADLRELWRFDAPFVRFNGIPMHWTMRAAKVRAVHADDVTGDGVPEVLVGAGSMHLHCLDADGTELWRTPVPTGARWTYGIPDTITTADLFGEGIKRTLVGNGLKSYSAYCTVLDQTGEVMQQFKNGGWAITVPAIAVGDLDGDGEQSVLCGNNLGDVRCFTPTRDGPRQRWWQNLSRVIRSLTIVPQDTGAIVAVGSDSGYLCAFDAEGEKVWGVALSSAIINTELIHRGEEILVAAGCEDGMVYVCSAEGVPVGRYDTGGALQAMAVGDVDGDAFDEIVAVTHRSDRIVVLGESDDPVEGGDR